MEASLSNSPFPVGQWRSLLLRVHAALWMYVSDSMVSPIQLSLFTFVFTYVHTYTQKSTKPCVRIMCILLHCSQASLSPQHEYTILYYHCTLEWWEEACVRGWQFGMDGFVRALHGLWDGIMSIDPYSLHACLSVLAVRGTRISSL